MDEAVNSVLAMHALDQWGSFYKRGHHITRLTSQIFDDGCGVQRAYHSSFIMEYTLQVTHHVDFIFGIMLIIIHDPKST